MKNVLRKIFTFFKKLFINIKLFFKMVFNKIRPVIIKIFRTLKLFLHKVLRRDATLSILSSVISILIGVFFGLIVMIIITFITDEATFIDAFAGLINLLQGPFSSSKIQYILNNVGDVIFYSTPLILTGLSVAIAYKTGLFNIGAPGQFIMGIIGSLIVALSIHTTNRVAGIGVWFLAILAGILLACLWGMIPGLLKALFNINEVIVCIMTNWIAANAATWLFENLTYIHSSESSKGGYLAKNLENFTPRLGLDKLFPGSYIDAGILIAIIVAIVIYIILNKTTFGYELKACGANRDASKYAGLNEKRNIVLSMVIAGALAGLGGCLYYLNSGIEYKFTSQYSSLPAYGFNGIASAFLANCNPIGVIFSSLFIRYINAGGEAIVRNGFNRYIADIIIAIIIYLAGFTRIIKDLMSKFLPKVKNDRGDVNE